MGWSRLWSGRKGEVIVYSGKGSHTLYGFLWIRSMTFENKGTTAMEDIAGVLKEMLKRRTEFGM
jgi:hypothetical protein